MKPSDIIASRLKELKSRYNVEKIGIFGSFGRGDDQSSSDVDILVSFSRPVDLFTFIELKEYLETLLGRGVDLATENALKPLMKDRVLREVSYL